jgi:hypothetical protein
MSKGNSFGTRTRRRRRWELATRMGKRLRAERTSKVSQRSRRRRTFSVLIGEDTSRVLINLSLNTLIRIVGLVAPRRKEVRRTAPRFDDDCDVIMIETETVSRFKVYYPETVLDYLLLWRQ